MYFCKMESTKKLSLILIVFITSCSRVHFDTPMPEKGNLLKAFPLDIVGTYYYADSTMNKDEKELFYNKNYFGELYKTRDSVNYISADVTISATLAYYNINYYAFYNISKVDTARVALKHKNDKKTIDGNYLIFAGNIADTLLNLSKEDKLKLYNGTYYFNHFDTHKDWEVFQFVTNKDHSYSINMTNAEDELQLKGYMVDTNSSFNAYAHLTDEKFKEFVQKGGFRTKYKLKKSRM